MAFGLLELERDRQSQHLRHDGCSSMESRARDTHVRFETWHCPRHTLSQSLRSFHIIMLKIHVGQPEEAQI